MSASLRWAALVTSVAFGCATARPPLTASAQPPPRVALAEPQLELWMEGVGSGFDDRESEEALEMSREALSQALADRAGLDEPDPQQLLFVHARAIARTGDRKAKQVLSVVGFVVVLAVVVVAVILLSKTGSPGRGHTAGSGHAVKPAPSGHGAPGPFVHGFAAHPYQPPPPPPFVLDLGVQVVVTPQEPPPPWLVPEDRWLSSRSWLDGDAVELTAELVDRSTGMVTWHRTVQAAIDPRDASAVSDLVDRALDGLPYGRKRQNPVESPAVTD